MGEFTVNYFQEPFEFFTFENFFTENQLKDVWKELDYITSNDLAITENQSTVGTAQDPETKERLAKRSGLFLEQLFTRFRESSKIYQHIKENVLVNTKLVESFPKSTLMAYLPHTNSDALLLSFYNDGDYYKPHSDTSVMTLIIYLWKGEKTYQGGELSFEDEDIIFDPDYNEAILFPGCRPHAVEKIISDGKKDYPFERLAISLFLTIRPMPAINDNI